MENGNSRILFITDLVIMFTFFFFVFKYYTGGTMVPLKGNVLMGLIVIYWFLISVNSNILRINRLSDTIAVSKDILIAYSVLSTITIATVAIFDEFRPNDKLILYPLLFGAISSCILRLCYLVISKQCLKHGYRKKSVLLIGGGHAARQITAKILSTPELGFRIQGSIGRQRPGPAH
jgi:FlaA1/EpsC-like NDP-sugar epimerase